MIVDGIDIHGFVPALDCAAEKGIAVTNTPDGPTNEAAEWAVTATNSLLNVLKTGQDTYLVNPEYSQVKNN